MTGQDEKITYFTVKPEGDDEAGSRSWLQVYGTGLTQEPFASRQNDVQQSLPALTTAGDKVSLLSLIRNWQKHRDNQHPLMETYGSFVGVSNQHPRLRFLMLIQALEGLYGADKKEENEEKQAQHTTDRSRIIELIKELEEAEKITADDRRFLSRNLSKRPASSLATALKHCVFSLPVDVSLKLDELELVRHVRNSDEDAKGWGDALRIARNNLSHGNLSYEVEMLRPAATLLERVTRTHLLRILGCPESVQERVLTQ